MNITRKIAARVLKVVDAGLVAGVGVPIPGRMCVEAAVCYVLGEPHGDDPSCVAKALRSLKIRLNDANWSSTGARAKGLRRLALAQLGSRGVVDEKEFARRVVDHALRVSVPSALRSAATVSKNRLNTAALLAAANKCETEGTRGAALEGKNAAADAADAADAAYGAAYGAAYAAAYAAAAADADAADAAYAASVAGADAYAARAAGSAARAAADAADAADAAYAASVGAAADNAAAYAAAAADADADAAAYTAAAAGADAYAARAAGSAARADADADAAAGADADNSLAEYAEAIVQILIEMKAPGCQWLDLAPVEA